MSYCLRLEAVRPSLLWCIQVNQVNEGAAARVGLFLQITPSFFHNFNNSTNLPINNCYNVLKWFPKRVFALGPKFRTQNYILSVKKKLFVKKGPTLKQHYFSCMCPFTLLEYYLGRKYSTFLLHVKENCSISTHIHS